MTPTQVVIAALLVALGYFLAALLFTTRLFRYQGSEVPVLPKNRKVKVCSFGCDTMWPDILVFAGRLGHYKTGLCSGEGTSACH